MASEIEKRNEAFLIYQDENGITRVNVRFEGEDVWLLQEQIMELFDASRQDVSYHINQIYAESEQAPERTHKKFLLVRQEGNRSVKRQMSHYNLDMIIAVGYRVKSQVATRFRQWATQRLREFIQKGFTLDDDRLKGKGNRYFRELLQLIRDIRSSERNLYQQVTDIFITSIDYDSNANLTRKFSATVQNKLHYAAHQCSQGDRPLVRVWEIGFVKYGDINYSHPVLSRMREIFMFMGVRTPINTGRPCSH